MFLRPAIGTAEKLRARAEELREMVRAARTADTRDALIAVAEKFEALALRRSDEARDDQAIAAPSLEAELLSPPDGLARGERNRNDQETLDDR
jgi:hypothetical protein